MSLVTWHRQFSVYPQQKSNLFMMSPVAS